MAKFHVCPRGGRGGGQNPRGHTFPLIFEKYIEMGQFIAPFSPLTFKDQ